MSLTPLYKKPVLLHRDTHRDTRIGVAPGGFGFAGRAHSMPLSATEFAEACREYPIVFARAGATAVAGPPESLAPVAMTGLRDGENLFVRPDGRWDGRYIPAFVRRYPFVLAELQGGQLGVCIDEGYGGLSSTEGEALFDAQGANTPFLQGALDFLNRYQADYARTQAFAQKLLSLDLFTEMNARADLKDGGRFTVGGLFIVDERKLLALPDDVSLALYRSGELSWIYAHLISLGNVGRLVDRLGDRGARAGGPVAAPGESQSA